MSLLSKAVWFVLLAAPLVAGCSGDDNAVPIPVADASGSSTSKSEAGPAESTDAAAKEGGSGDASMSIHDGGDAGDSSTGKSASASFSAASLSFGPVGCGAPAATKTLSITNSGGSPLTIAASTAGTAFSVTPTSLTVAPGSSGALTVAATVPSTVTAGTALTGSLSLFTNDPNNTSEVFPLSVTPSGATLGGTATYDFGTIPVGTTSTAVTLNLTNQGNATGIFTFGTPQSSTVTLAGASAPVSLAPNASVSISATFSPTDTTAVDTTVTITPPAGVCGSGISTLHFSGTGTRGQISGFPSSGTIDFGNVSCGSTTAPSSQQITLSNTSSTTATHITSIDTSASNGFTTDATVGATIAPMGSLVVHFMAPQAGPTTISQVTGTIVVHTDADTSAAGTSITLTEEPQGAVLQFSSASTTGCTTSSSFGSFAAVGTLLQSAAPQTFCVVNQGTAPANVTLQAAEGTFTADASVNSAPDATVGPADAFSLSTPGPFTVAAATSSGPGLEQESISFSPVHAGATTGYLAMIVDPSSILCAAPPQPLPLAGSVSSGAVPVLSTTSLSFPATCGGAAPTPGTLTIGNASGANLNLNWSMSGLTGPGASLFTLAANPPAGQLAPGQQSQITVNASALPSPVTNPDPSALTAQFTVTTDVPFDPPHVITLTEVPIGDQLFVTVPDGVGNTLRFGQVPVTTQVSRSFTVTNNANVANGSAPANVTMVLGGTGTAAYSAPGTVTVAPGGQATVTETFDEATAGNYPATLTFTSSDPQCTPLPSPVSLTGTAVAGSLQLSQPTLTFGTNPSDPLGLVNCGATGNPQTLTLTNIGTGPLNITSVGVGKSSVYLLSGPGTAVPVALAIGDSTSITVTPAPIGTTGIDPTSTTAFADALQIGTDVPGLTVPPVSLVMQAQGAVITGTAPPTTWSFGTVPVGSIGTFLGTTLQNAGNLAATVTLAGATSVSLPSVFGLQGNPVTIPAQSTVGLVGQFTPNASDASWSGEGVLTVTAAAFCNSLPTAWNMPQVAFSGSSTASAVVQISGSLAFPTTDCDSAPPSGQAVTLTNQSNQEYSYTVSFASGTYYTFADSGSGTLAPNNTTTIVVNPKTIVPGPGVQAGSAPYADDLIVKIATSPATTFTEPISWTLNGAVLSLPQGAGPYGTPGSSFYAADTTTGFTLPMSNSGTATASVQLSTQPLNAFSLQPTSVNILPNIPASPTLAADGADGGAPACSGTPGTGTATFLYSGPVCQPFPLSSVNVQYCAGTLTP